MADPFDPIVDKILDVEGRTFTNDPSDAGGATNFGITAAELGDWRHLGRAATPQEVKQLQEPEARQIYRSRFITGPGFDLVYLLAPLVGAELIDSGVNLGVGTPGPWLQRTLNALNDRQAYYADVAVDGKVGPASRAAISGLIAKRGLADAQTVLLRGLNGFQVVKYIELCEARAANEDFAFGWLKNRVGM